ncbi:GNAT family N-acetyltransferase [Aeromicrobium sp. SMF47]|uniref:GNAT family N-acetyltransferase n=1 Tax=Aeromicrobium yanjiei TaxID=2662028 RepID=A0A5Q2MMJ0_9ACTN|nr:GNAT family N-acetyltransferase [Aeromicrobium yanjiei]MRK00774.1 GNAT family N-acetyltransferase [Aeromicrobium sp. S22]QGG42406.1 GNAT family N-acetyltransferase [Aeromicrobium yanjiei]
MSPGWPVELQHGSVGVRPVRRRDARAWARLRADNADWLGPWEATLPREAGSPASSYVGMISTLRRRARLGHTMPFALTWDGELVGMLTVNGITWGSARWANMGYWVSRSHAGRGITPIAVALVCDHLLTTVGLHRVEIAIRPENAASLRVVEKLGFTEIGVARRFLHIAGEWRDHRIFQILAEDVPGGLMARVQAPGQEPGGS